MKGSSIPDREGCPLKVSSVITFRIVNAVESLFRVNDIQQFIIDQGLQVLKTVISRFPFNSQNSSEVSLLNEKLEIGKVWN